MVSFASVERSVVIEVIKKFAENIDYLRVCGKRATELIEAVELVPSVVHLELVFLSNYDDDYVQPSKKARRDEKNEVLNLLRLRKLKIERCENHFLVMFNRLPADVLIELTLHQKSLCQLANLFRTQTNIKKLSIFNGGYSHDDPIIDTDIFDALQIESLEWHADSFEHKNIRSILAKQKNLKTLKLIGGGFGVDLLNVITNQLHKLETLSIAVSYIPVAAFKSISKLVNLKELTLQSGEEQSVERFKEFAKLDNSRITTINIQHCYYISNDLINAMAKSLPNLKNVSFHCKFNINTFHAILKNFNYVEALHLNAFNFEFDTKDRKGNYTTLLKQGCENVTLTELKICYPISYTVKIVEKIAMDYPHLKKLIFLPPATPTNRDFDKQLKAILKGFKELESLSILQDTTSFDRRYHDSQLILDYGINLKFVALMDMECSTLQHIEKKFKEIFGVIKYSRTDGLTMAVSRKTMETEWEDVEHCR